MEYKDIFVVTDLPKPYSEEELYNRFLDMKNGDVSARKDIIEHNLRLVISVVSKKFYNTNYDESELVAIGMIGLIKGVNTFDVSKKIKFMTYAITCIRNEVLIFLRRSKRDLGISSLEETFYNDGESDEICYKDIIVDESVDFVLDYENKEINEIIRDVISRLPENDKKIISMYFGFYDNIPMNQRDIAKVLGISQSYISRILNRIVNKISIELQRQGIIEVRGFCKSLK